MGFTYNSRENGVFKMKEVSHNEWMDTVKKLNEGQPSVIDLVNQQAESIRKTKKTGIKKNGEKSDGN